MALDARIVAAHLVTPFRRQGTSGKNDANDAAAICEVSARPGAHFVPIKSVEQQSVLCVHRLREGLKEECTACINRIRGLLAEFGLVIPQGPDALQMSLHDLLGIGPVTASAVVATVVDFKQFDNGAQFGAWIGLTPRQHSSGGKSKLGRITKRGDTYLRTLLIQAAKSAVLTAHRRSDKNSDWLLKLRERSGWQIAAVALPNKNARILWAIMTKGEDFDVNHRSDKPAGSTQPAQAT